MNVLVIGGSGLLGPELVPALIREGANPLLASRSTNPPVDITHIESLRAQLSRYRPDAVILAAAATDVDALEGDPDRAFRVNALGARSCALACMEQGARLCYISTDYVFDGLQSHPYSEFDIPNPISVYGRSKLAGEQYVRQIQPGSQVVRIAGLYGPARSCFPGRILDRASSGHDLKLIADQHNSPTSSRQAARMIAQLVRQGMPGIYHAAGRGEATPLAMGLRLLRAAGLQATNVESISYHDWTSPARRPIYSVLRRYILELQGDDDMEPWESEIDHFAAEWLKARNTG